MNLKRFTPWVVLSLFLIPTGILWYKSQRLNISLLPHKVDDVWNLHIAVKPKDPAATSVSFPIPRDGDGLKISDERTKSKGFDTLIDRNSDSAMLIWLAKEPIENRVTYNARIDIRPVQVKNIPKDYTVVGAYPRQVKKYLKMAVLAPEEESAVALLEGAIYEGGEDKTTLARKAFYYVNEEIQRDVKFTKISEALNIGKGSPLVKARLYSYLLRRKEIPARIVVMIRLPLPGDPPVNKHTFTYANEAFLNNRWIPVDTNRGHFGERPARYLVMHHHFEEIEKTITKKKLSYTMLIDRAVMNKFNKEEYRKTVLKKGPIFSAFSLYRLPLPVQNVFATILLIPFGALVLCFARNILGVPTFGMFTPILLTIFFRETSLSFGLFFFGMVVLIGLFERYFLDKLFLLAVPRMSILLTLTIVLLMVVALTGLAESFGAGHIGYFPIVIMTSFVERFSIMLTEDGIVNTMKTLFGTLTISILTYLLYLLPTLEILVFTNPEILMYVIGILILIGKYKGYRISELIRFQDLLRQLKKKEAA